MTGPENVVYRTCLSAVYFLARQKLPTIFKPWQQRISAQRNRDRFIHVFITLFSDRPGLQAPVRWKSERSFVVVNTTQNEKPKARRLYKRQGFELEVEDRVRRLSFHGYAAQRTSGLEVHGVARLPISQSSWVKKKQNVFLSVVRQVQTDSTSVGTHLLSMSPSAAPYIKPTRSPKLGQDGMVRSSLEEHQSLPL